MARHSDRVGGGSGLIAVAVAVLLGVIVSAALVVPARVNAGDGGFSYHPGEHSGDGVLGVAWELEKNPDGWFRIDEDGTVSGSDGCNGFGGSDGHLVRQDNTGRTIVEFGPVISTMMACIDDQGTQRIMTSLTGADKVTIFLGEDGTARIKGDGGSWETFVPR